MPAVSVVIPAYNQGQFVGEAIQSVLDQTFADVEAIVVDDGSTDDTGAIVAQYSDPRVRYVRQENQGLSAARNTGILNAAGDYVSFLDSDDTFLPRKVEALLGVLASQPEMGICAGQAIPIDEYGAPVGRVFDVGLPPEPRQLLLGNPLHVGSVLIRQVWLERVGLFDTSLRSYEDWDMWLRLGLAGCGMQCIDEPVSLYRFHSEQMTRDQNQMTQASFKVLDKVFSRPDLPPDWQAMEGIAYSRGYLRAAAQAYRSGKYAEAQAHLREAVARDPDLAANDCDLLARQIAGWADLPKVGDPVEFLARIYDHLPPEFQTLRRRRRRDLSECAVQRAFEAHERQNAEETRRACLQAFRYQPQWLTNRGVLSIFIRSNFTGVRQTYV